MNRGNQALYVTYKLPLITRYGRTVVDVFQIDAEIIVNNKINDDKLLFLEKKKKIYSLLSIARENFDALNFVNSFVDNEWQQTIKRNSLCIKRCIIFVCFSLNFSKLCMNSIE